MNEPRNSVAGASIAHARPPETPLPEHEVQPWMGLPLWIPGVDMRDSIARAVDAGLVTRPVDETARDTLAWNRSRPAEGTFEHALGEEKEREILAARGAE